MTSAPDRSDLSAKLHAGSVRQLGGRYRVMREVESIGGASIFLAQDLQKSHQQVLVVLPALKAMSSKHAVDVLVSKANAAKNLVHASISPLDEVCQDEAFGYKGTFLVYRYTGGESLRERLASRGALPVELAVKLLKPVADAIDKAHLLGLHHGGLAPSWVFIDGAGNPQVFGFGVGDLVAGRASDSDEWSNALLPYMSPEELDGASVSIKQDVYRFGVLGFECLTGNPPFYRGQIRRQILNSEPYAGRLRLIEGLSPAVADQLLQCLSKDPRQRLESVKEVFGAPPEHSRQARSEPASDSSPLTDGDASPSHIAEPDVRTTSPPLVESKVPEAKSEILPVADNPLVHDYFSGSGSPSDEAGSSEKQKHGGREAEAGRSEKTHADQSTGASSRSHELPATQAKPAGVQDRSKEKQSGANLGVVLLVILMFVGPVVLIGLLATQQQETVDDSYSSVPVSEEVKAKDLREKSLLRQSELAGLIRDPDFGNLVSMAGRQFDSGESAFESGDWDSACRQYESYLDEVDRILELQKKQQVALVWREKSSRILIQEDTGFLAQNAYESWNRLRETYREAERAVENKDFDKASRLYALFTDQIGSVRKEAQLCKAATDLHKEARIIREKIDVAELFGITRDGLAEIRESYDSGEREFSRRNYSDAIQHYQRYVNRVRILASNGELYRTAEKAKAYAETQRRRWDSAWQAATSVASEIRVDLVGYERAGDCLRAIQRGHGEFQSGKYLEAANAFNESGDNYRFLEQKLRVHLIGIAQEFDRPGDKLARDKALRVLDLLVSLDPRNTAASELRTKIAGYLYFPDAANKIRDTCRIPLTDRLSLPMTYVPPGTFMMGSPLAEPGRNDDEGYRRVHIAVPYMIGVTEVTQSQWRAVMGQGLKEQYAKAGKRSSKSHTESWTPMYYIGWGEAVEFCKKLTDKERKAGRLPEGLVFRLPTEAEWEYACRAGGKGPFALDKKPTELGWFESNSEDSLQGIAIRSPNKWGIHDMHGNLYEWCADRYLKDYPDVERDPYVKPAGADQSRVLRGGAWISRVSHCRSAARHSDDPDTRSHTIGFRVVLARPLEGLGSD